MKNKRITFRLLALSGSLLLAFGFAEAGVRVLGIDHRKNDLGVAPHPLWHHWHRSSYSFDYQVVAEGYTVPVHFNARGMRDRREIALMKGAGVLRVAVLGDSFIEAMQVREEDGVCRQLEKQLSEQLGRPVEVLNFGCSGFSSTLELVLLREQVLRFSPDLIVCLYHFSDVSEDWSFRSKARLSAGRATAVPMSMAPAEQAARDLLESSQLVRLTRGRLSGTRRRGVVAATASLQQTFDAIVHEPYSDDDEAAWAYSLDAVEGMAALAKEKDIPFLLVVIPIGTQVEPVDAAFAKELGFAYLAGGQRLESLAYQRKVAGFCRERSIGCLDLLNAFRQANPEGKPRFYLPRDQHWTAAAHELAARRIALALDARSASVRAKR